MRRRAVDETIGARRVAVSIRYSHIACCMDESAASEEALVHAVALATAGGATLALVHVGPFPLMVEEVNGATVARREDLNATARAWIEERARTVPDSHAVFLEGSAGPAICHWAAEAGVDLLVVGAHHGRVESLLFGSVSGHIVNHAPCPVLVVRLWPAATAPRAHVQREAAR